MHTSGFFHFLWLVAEYGLRLARKSRFPTLHYYADNIDKQEINLSYAGDNRRNVAGRGNNFDEVPGPVFEWMD